MGTSVSPSHYHFICALVISIYMLLVPKGQEKETCER